MHTSCALKFTVNLCLGTGMHLAERENTMQKLACDGLQVATAERLDCLSQRRLDALPSLPRLPLLHPAGQNYVNMTFSTSHFMTFFAATNEMLCPLLVTTVHNCKESELHVQLDPTKEHRLWLQGLDQGCIATLPGRWFR